MDKNRTDSGARMPSSACLRVGRLEATTGVVIALMGEGIDPYALLRRHERGDYGNLSETQRRANEVALLQGGRILSRHDMGKDALWIVTDADRCLTSLIMQSEILDEQDVSANPGEGIRPLYHGHGE